MDKPKCHSLIITGKVQDIGFRSIVEHIGRSFGIPGMVFNARDGSVKIVCSGEDAVIDNFKQTIMIRGKKNGAEIIDIKESVNIELPEDFAKASSDDEIDIGRKLDKANLLLKTGFENLNADMNTGFNNLTGMLGSFVGEQREHNSRLEAMVTGINEHNTRLEAMVTGINEHNTRLEAHNTRLEAHNTRLEAILEKLADRA